MSIKLAKNNTPAYDYFSEGDGSDPITGAVILDNSGGTEESAVITAHLIATTYKYTGISVTPISEETGVNWQVSLDNVIFAESVTPADMDALATDQTVPIYLKAVVADDGSLPTSIKTGCDVEILATETAA